MENNTNSKSRKDMVSIIIGIMTGIIAIMIMLLSIVM